MSAVKRSETHSRWSLTIHSSSIVHWSSASVVATRAATNGPKTTRADKQHLGLKETLKCTIPMQCMQKDNLVRNPFLVECSYLWESIYQFLWQRHQTMFNLDFKDFGHRSVWQGSPGGRERACVRSKSWQCSHVSSWSGACVINLTHLKRKCLHPGYFNIFMSPQIRSHANWKFLQRHPSAF